MPPFPEDGYALASVFSWPGLSYGLVLLGMGVSLLSVPFGVPGVWIMVALASFLAFSGAMSWPVWFALGGIAAVAELAEWGAVGALGRKYGGSARAFWGAILGGFAGLFVGLPVPILGSVIAALIGSVLGAAVVTLWETRSLRDAGRVGWGTLLGRILATGLKIAAGLAILFATAAALVAG